MNSLIRGDFWDAAAHAQNYVNNGIRTGMSVSKVSHCQSKRISPDLEKRHQNLLFIEKWGIQIFQLHYVCMCITSKTGVSIYAIAYPKTTQRYFWLHVTLWPLIHVLHTNVRRRCTCMTSPCFKILVWAETSRCIHCIWALVKCMEMNAWYSKHCENTWQDVYVFHHTSYKYKVNS